MAAVNNVPKDLQDAIREFLGRKVKLYIKRMVKQEVRLDKWENRVVAFSGTRLFVFSSKTSKSPEHIYKPKQEHNICYLDIQTIESNKPNKLVITTYEGKSYSFVTLETETDEVNHMITHIGTSIKQIFPAFPLERIIKNVDVQPPERLKMMVDMMKTIETKEHGPCGNFTMMYGCMCDYFNLHYMEEVPWDIDNIYSSQECKVLRLKDFDHLASAKDLLPIVSSIENNTWFTGMNLSRVKMTIEIQGEFLKVMQKNCLIEEINLSKTGITVEFVTKLGTAILSNAGSQLTKVDLSKNGLDDRAMTSFLDSLSNLSRGLTHLNISDTRLTGKGLNKIFEILIQHKSIFIGLQVLNISDNPTKGEDLQQMYKFLTNPNAITHLDLSGTECALENLMVALQRGCINLTHLYLTRNIFTYKKLKEIVVHPSWKQFFSTMCCVEHLDLSYCKLPVEALKDLMLGISSNMHLTNLHLNIAGNDFQQQGSLNIENTIANIQNISSLDISNNNLDLGLVTLLPWIRMSKSLKHLSLGRNFSLLKSKTQLKAALEGVVQLIEDEDCNIESLSLADSKLKYNVESVINAVGSNGSLTELDISGNYMGDLGARWLSKTLQINNKLKTIIWDRNGTTFQGFEDIAEALEKNYTLKKMPVPLNDICGQQKHPERTEAAIQKIEALLQRNHSPQKFPSEHFVKIQWSYLGSLQQQVDRLIVQVRDTIEALQRTPSADDYKEDIDVALGYVNDANNSQMLLPQLQNKADESVGEDNPVAQRLKEISLDLKEVLDMQMKKTVEGMLECTTNKLTAVTKNKEFATELQSGCVSNSSLPEDFAIHTMNVVKMEIFNKLSELNLSVAYHISDRVIAAVIDNLSSSLKTLTKHLKKEDNKQTKPKEEDLDTDVKPPEPSSSDSSPVVSIERKRIGNTIKIPTRPRTVVVTGDDFTDLKVTGDDLTDLKAIDETVSRKKEPKKVPGSGDAKLKVKGEVDDEPTTSISSGKGKAAKSGGKKGKSGKEENDTEEKGPKDGIDLPIDLLPVAVNSQPLVHFGKDRPARPQIHRPKRPTTPAINIVEKDINSTEENNNIDYFFKSAVVTSSQPKFEKDVKNLKTVTTETKADVEKSRSLFGKEKQSKTVLGGIFSAFGKTKSPKDHEKKEEVKAVVPKKVSSTPDKENIELEKKKEIQEPEKEEPKVEVKHETEEVKEVKEPKKAMKPPMGGMGEMLFQLKQRQQSGKSTGKNPTVEKEVITPPKTETATPDKSAQDKSATPVPDTTNSPSKTANNTDEPKATPDKTPKSVISLVPDQNRPKAASRPRNTSSRISTESRNSGVNQDSEDKGSPKPALRPNIPPKPRISLKSDASDSPRSSDSGKRLSTESKDKNTSLPGNVSPVTEQAEKGSRPTSMNAQSGKDETDSDKTMSTSRTAGELVDSDELINDMDKIVEAKNEGKESNQDDQKKDNDSKKEEKKDEKESEKIAENRESKGSSSENGDSDRSSAENLDSKRSSAETGDSKGSSAESDDSKQSSTENTISEEEKTDFESDVIMV